MAHNAHNSLQSPLCQSSRNGRCQFDHQLVSSTNAISLLYAFSDLFQNSNKNILDYSPYGSPASSQHYNINPSSFNFPMQVGRIQSKSNCVLCKRAFLKSQNAKYVEYANAQKFIRRAKMLAVHFWKSSFNSVPTLPAEKKILLKQKNVFFFNRFYF